MSIKQLLSDLDRAKINHIDANTNNDEFAKEFWVNVIEELRKEIKDARKR
jgi:hypothetical protein